MTEICDKCGQLITDHHDKHVNGNEIFCGVCIEKVLFEDGEE